jgi:hypothetical protein
VLAQSPRQASSLYVRGIAKLRAGNIAGGRADVAAAEATDPGIAEIYRQYGVSE